MLNGWIWSNLLAGTMEAIATYFFLTYMEVPGVWVWTGLALFAELVPKLGLYIMAVPPVLITLSISPMTALWVLIFYLILNEIMGDLVIPRIRASTMNLHPVSTLFSMLALASAFGLIGALIATPLTAFVKAYYETFYVPTVSKENIKDQVNMVLARKEKTEHVVSQISIIILHCQSKTTFKQYEYQHKSQYITSCQYIIFQTGIFDGFK
ncbi:MAG: AI-2E family transporter [Saprospiraceae bacterium]|nr:AI-2E family transporter [Candidatus Brachybacter algidus]